MVEQEHSIHKLGLATEIDAVGARTKASFDNLGERGGGEGRQGGSESGVAKVELSVRERRQALMTCGREGGREGRREGWTSFLPPLPRICKGPCNLA